MINMKIVYTIGSGKTGTSEGTGLKGWLYIISIQSDVSEPYTCPPKNAPINPIIDINKKESVTPSIYFMRFSFESFKHKKRTAKNQKIAQNREKL